MTAEFNPDQAEGAYVSEAQYKPAVAPTVTLTLSMSDAQLIRALLGHTISPAGAIVHGQLDGLLRKYDNANIISFIESDVPVIDAGKARKR